MEIINTWIFLLDFCKDDYLRYLFCYNFYLGKPDIHLKKNSEKQPLVKGMQLIKKYMDLFQRTNLKKKI